MKSNLKRNAFFTVIGFTLLIFAMMVLFAVGSINFKLDVIYVITHILIVIFLLFIDYQAFKMWQYDEKPEKSDEKDVELEIKEPANE